MIWKDDIKGRMRPVTREKAAEFAAQSVSGVKLELELDTG